MLPELSPKPSDTITFESIPAQADVINQQLPPIKPECKTAVVIPVHREFDNGKGNIVKLLEELDRQTIGLNNFETLLIINSQLSGHAFIDNRELLNWLEWKKAYGSFPNVHPIDCTLGEIPRRHMGLVRGLGHTIAEQRLLKTAQGAQTVMVQTDADCSMDPYYLEQLLAHYKNPAIHSAMVGKISFPLDRPADFLSDDYYAAYALSFAEAVENALKKRGNENGDGPTLSFRTGMHLDDQLREYYMKQTQTEDYHLGRMLARKGGMHLLIEPRIYKGDRERPDGFDSADRESWVGLQPYWSTIDTLLSHHLGKNIINEWQYRHTAKSEFWDNFNRLYKLIHPQKANVLDDALEKEEALARRSLNWDELSPDYRSQGQYLYALSRLTFEGQSSLAIS